MKLIYPYLILFVFVASIGCAPRWENGDIIIGTNSGGLVSTKMSSAGVSTTLYGIEVEGAYGANSVKENHILTLVVVPPANDTWKYAGGGSIRQWHQYIYPQRWKHFPIIHFVKPEENGSIHETSERKDFVFEYDGRKRLVRISGKRFPVSVGEFVLVILGRNWEPHVIVGVENIDASPISVEIKDTLLRFIDTFGERAYMDSRCK